jgi:hypothetical protein
MIIFIGILGFITGIVGLFIKIKGAIITSIVWALYLTSVFLSSNISLRGSLLLVLISVASLICQLIWIIVINRNYERGIRK